MSTITETTAALLRAQVESKCETITKIMTANDRNPNLWTCAGDCDDEECAHVGECPGPDGCHTASDLRDEYGSDGPGDALRDLPLSVTYERGRPFSVLLAFGGPNVEITGDVAYPGSFRLVGSWYGEDDVTMRHADVTEYAQWWIDLLDDMGTYA